MSHLSRKMGLFAPWFVVITALSISGCGPKYANEKAVYKIQGTVIVDGIPVPDIQVAFHDVAGPDNKQPTYPQGFTNAEGKLRISTYAEGDGAPAGEYKVTFKWQEYNLISRSFGGEDKLKKRYADPKTTPITIKLGEGQPNDLGTVQLTTK